MLRSGMGPPCMGGFEHLMDAEGCRLAMSHGVYDFAASVDAIASRKIMRVFRLHALRINNNTAILQFKLGDLLKKFQLALLAQRLDHHFYIQAKFGAGYRNIAAA